MNYLTVDRLGAISEESSQLTWELKSVIEVCGGVDATLGVVANGTMPDSDEEDLWGDLDEDDTNIKVSSNLLEVPRASPSEHFASQPLAPPSPKIWAACTGVLISAASVAESKPALRRVRQRVLQTVPSRIT